jgi:tetraacyldisaccharide 4'-kinase
MKTPVFWQSRNLLSALLLPLSAIYGITARITTLLSASPLALPIPVICIGNVTAGGAGKTPVAIAIGQRLKAKNAGAYFLSRGYGGAFAGPLLVNSNIHTAHEVGDEPLLLARTLPTVVAKNRLSGAMFAMKYGAKVIVMDDGFQNPSIEKTLSLLVVDGVYGFGNGRLLPAGPLRELPKAGFARADAMIVVGKTDIAFPPTVPVISATIVPAAAALALKGHNVLAFCGLAFPQKFFTTLVELGAHVVDTAIFADHYPYTKSDIKKLHARAKLANAVLVTTAKDAVRLLPEWASLVTVVDISLTFGQPDLMDRLIETALK